MRIVAFSDSHGDASALRRGIEKLSQEKPPDVFLHLGDGTQEFLQLEILMRNINPAAQVLAVRGNNDYGVHPVETEKEIALCGLKTLLVHGHHHHVKISLQYLSFIAREKGCGLAFYGHTHRAKAEWVNGVWLLNPGSCGWGESTALQVDITDEGSIHPCIVTL